MFEEVIKTALSQSLWAGLCIVLLAWFLKETSDREKETRKLYAALAGVLEELKSRIGSIDTKLDLMSIRNKDIDNSLETIRSLLNTLDLLLNGGCSSIEDLDKSLNEAITKIELLDLLIKERLKKNE